MGMFWLAQAAYFFCTSVIIVHLFRRMSPNGAGLVQLVQELKAIRQSDKEKDRRIKELETSNRELERLQALHRERISAIRESFAQAKALEQSCLETVSRMAILRREREGLLLRMAQVGEDEIAHERLTDELSDLDDEMSTCLERAKNQNLSSRQRYIEMVGLHSDMLQSGHPFDDILWIKTQSEKAYGLAMEIVAQLHEHLAQVESQRQFYQNSMERMKKAYQIPGHGDAISVSRGEDKPNTMPCPSEEPATLLCRTDSDVVSALDSKMLKSALRQPSLPQDLLLASRESDEPPDSSVEEAHLRSLISSLERISSLPASSQIVIEDEHELAVFCRFLMRKVRLSEKLRSSLGHDGPPANDVRVSTLSWVAPFYH